MIPKILMLICVVLFSCCSKGVSDVKVTVPEMIKLRPGVANITKYGILRQGSIIDDADDVKIGNVWFSTCTITISQWKEFIRQTNYQYWKWDDEIDPDIYFYDLQLCPIVSVTWYEALLYCNWLSQKNGLSAVYEIKGKVDRNNSKYPVVIWHKDRNGYRLPTPEEWQYGVYQEYINIDSVLSALKREDEASLSTDGALDSRNRSRFKIFGSKDVFRNTLGIYVNLSQNIDEYVWGFGINDDGVILRHYGEKSVTSENSPDLSKEEVLCFYQNSVSTYRAKKPVYCASFRVVRNDP